MPTLPPNDWTFSHSLQSTNSETPIHSGKVSGICDFPTLLFTQQMFTEGIVSAACCVKGSNSQRQRAIRSLLGRSHL